MVRRVLSVFVVALAVSAAAWAAEDAPVSQLPNSLKSVKAGQWARYRVNTLFGVAEQKQTVVDVSGTGDDRLVTIRTEMSLDDEIVDSREETATYRKLLDDQAAALEEIDNVAIAPCETALGTITVPGVEIGYTRDGLKYTLRLSETIPLAGVIRLEAEGAEEPLVELIDFGD